MYSFQFHIRDYVTKTRHLSLMEDLAYRRLIDAYYTEESALPADVQACARLIAMREHADAVEAVLREYFLLTDTGWTNPRCDQEIARFRALQESGRRASALRWKASDGSPIRNPSGTHQEPNANPMPTSNQKPETKKPRTTTASKAVQFDWESGVWVGTDAMLPAWEQAYPGVDVPIELAKAKAWVLQNPGKVSGMKNWAQFLGNWLRRCGADSSAVPTRAPTPSTNVFEGLA